VKIKLHAFRFFTLFRGDFHAAVGRNDADECAAGDFSKAA
jgi:hypothetical protein